MKGKTLISLSILIVAVLVLAACGSPPPPPPGGVISGSIATTTTGGNMIVGLFIIIVGVAASLGAYRFFDVNKGKVAAGVLGLFVLGALAYGSVVAVDQGQVGVLVRFGRAVSALNPGMNFVMPYADRVVLFSTRDWTYATMSDPVNQGNEDYKDWPVDLITKDGVQAAVKYTVQGRLNAADALKAYQRYGTLENAITQAVKNPSRVIVRQELQDFDAPELYQNVDRVDASVEEKLEPLMNDAGLTLVLFGFRKPSLGVDGDYEQQLNAAQVAEQAALVAQQNVAVKEAEAQQAVAQAEGQRQVTVLNAQAGAEATLAQQRAEADAALYRAQKDAEAKKVAAGAEAYSTLTVATAQADANALLAASVTADLIEYTRWTRWNGVLPQWVTDSNAFVTVPR